MVCAGRRVTDAGFGGAAAKPSVLMQVGEDGDGEEGEEEGDGDSEGSGSGAGAAAALAALQKVHGMLQKAHSSASSIADKMSDQLDASAESNEELAKQVKLLSDILHPPKKPKLGPEDKESDESLCQYRSCADCVADPQCGWCMTKQMCVQGDERHPFSPVCTDWTFDACPCA